MKSDLLEKILKKGGSIHIKKKNRGKFTDYCEGKVTQTCIDKAKASNNPVLKKRAIFAENAKKWKHLNGGKLYNPYNYSLNVNKFLEGGNVLADFKTIDSKENSDYVYKWASNNPFDVTYRVELPQYYTNPVQLPDEESALDLEFKLTYKDYDLPTKVLHSENDKKIGNTETSKLINDVFNYFIEKGLSKELASGFVGNFIAESGLNTSSVNADEKNSGLTKYGRGIALWSNSRLDDFIKFTGVSPENASLKLLLDFTWYEMNLRPALMNALKKVKTPEESAELVYRGFENGGNKLASENELTSIYTRSWDNLRKKNPKYPVYNYTEQLRKRIQKSINALKHYSV